MPTTKFIKQLSLLNKPQIKAFRRFVRSPYHNSVKRLSPLLEEILVYHPKFEDENLAVDKLFVHLYPDTDKEHEGRVNVLFTKLLKLLDEFRIIENFKANKLLYQQVKMQSYEAEEMDKSYFKAAKEYEVLLKKTPKDEKHALCSFLHYERVYEHTGTKKHEQISIPFERCLFFLNKSFLHYSLAYTLRSKNRNRVLNSKDEVPLLTFILERSNIDIEENPTLSFYKTLIDLQKNEDHFEKAAVLFMKLHSSFPLTLQKEGMTILLNIGMKKLRNGSKNTKPILVILYKMGLEQGLFLNKENQLNGTTFTNVVSLVAACHDFDWVKDFIKKKSIKIIDRDKKDAIHLSWGYYYYHKAVFSKKEEDFVWVIKYLNDVQFKGAYLFYRVQLLLLRTYYEHCFFSKKEACFLLNKIGSFDQILKRKKQKLGSKFIPFNQFSRKIRKLIQLKLNDETTSAKIDDFREEISSEKQLFSKEWLLQKTGELYSSPD